jgi:hypothetical protein
MASRAGGADIATDIGDRLALSNVRIDLRAKEVEVVVDGFGM